MKRRCLLLMMMFFGMNRFVMSGDLQEQEDYKLERAKVPSEDEWEMFAAPAISLQEMLQEMASCDANVAAAPIMGVGQSQESTLQKKTFQCPECQKLFSYQSGLSRHTKEQHKQQGRLFKCSMCDKPFTRNSNCLRHMKTCALPIAAASSDIIKVPSEDEWEMPAMSPQEMSQAMVSCDANVAAAPAMSPQEMAQAMASCDANVSAAPIMGVGQSQKFPLPTAYQIDPLAMEPRREFNQDDFAFLMPTDEEISELEKLLYEMEKRT